MTSNANMLFGRLRLRQLNLIIAIGKHNSLRKAAAELAMTQSTASKALHEAELILGDKLFERRRDGLYANRFGECAINYAHVIRKDITALSDELAEIKTGSGGKIRVGVIMGGVPKVLKDSINHVCGMNKDIVVEIYENTSAIMLAMLNSDKLDVVIGRTSVSQHADNYDYMHLAEENVSIVVGNGNPLAQKADVALPDLKNSRWIAYPNRTPLNILLKQELERAGINAFASPIETASTFITMTLLSDSDDFVALIPTDVASFFANHGLITILPIRLPSRSQPFGLITRKQRNQTRAAKLFIDAILQARTLPAAALPG
ncbi:LysR family transcriptional regulator [Paralcaligenes sp. KSB-10]|uniref:LysR family transcriptional regulator n=1 Tax=Paralcaligenes sp. KSB-10 TaxID=2901142 RepID=UPI001E597C23|nr:LysR family transcriptional regulator [Paralcaligenes sp. KSB-10]UHL63872.1 LysR family transcriptional regulator [Paralcaligenes sp. KSB-10]